MKSEKSNGRKPPKKTLVDHVYHEIQNRILYNIWGTGYQALEQELCEELGVSRTPVREALIRLQRDGLVNVVPRHGMRVLPISATDIQQIYQILTSLESLAVELAAARELSAKDYKSLDNALKEMKRAQDASDLKAWAQADEDFHYHLVALSANRILIELVDSFWGRAQRARLTMLSIRNNPINSTQDHAKIVDAIRRGDSLRARELIEGHRKRGASDLTELMEKHLNVPLVSRRAMESAQGAAAMIRVIVYVKLKPGTLADALACYAVLIPEIMANEPGCLEYAPQLDHDAGLPNQEKDGDMIVVCERWQSLEDFRKHIAMPHSAAFRARIADYLRERITVRVMQSAGGAH